MVLMDLKEAWTQKIRPSLNAMCKAWNISGSHDTEAMWSAPPHLLVWTSLGAKPQYALYYAWLVAMENKHLLSF